MGKMGREESRVGWREVERRCEKGTVRVPGTRSGKARHRRDARRVQRCGALVSGVLNSVLVGWRF